MLYYSMHIWMATPTGSAPDETMGEAVARHHVYGLVCKSITISNLRLAFFPWSRRSFHQVYKLSPSSNCNPQTARICIVLWRKSIWTDQVRLRTGDFQGLREHPIRRSRTDPSQRWPFVRPGRWRERSDQQVKINWVSGGTTLKQLSLVIRHPNQKKQILNLGYCWPSEDNCYNQVKINAAAPPPYIIVVPPFFWIALWLPDPLCWDPQC